MIMIYDNKKRVLKNVWNVKAFFNISHRSLSVSSKNLEIHRSYSPALCESDVGAPCAAGGCIADTCASCTEAACAGSEPIWPEMATACPWRAPLIVVGTWAIVLAIWATAVLPGIWWTLLGAWCSVVGLWCNVVGTCGIPPGICGTCGMSSWLAAAYWQGVNGRFATACGMLPLCLRSRALRLLNHTWNGAHDT